MSQKKRLKCWVEGENKRRDIRVAKELNSIYRPTPEQIVPFYN